MKDTLELYRQFSSKEGKRFAVIEGNRDCNRNCSYCAVPQKYNKDREVTVAVTRRNVDWLYGQGYRMLSYIGGEPLAPFRTKEGISFFDHTLAVVEHASNKGMLVNVTTNGDFVDRGKVEDLKTAGLDTLSFSLHTFTRVGLDHLLEGARVASEVGIVPTVQVVFTKDRSKQLPGIAAHVARSGVLFSIGLVQEKGGDFSTAATGESKVPSPDEQREVFGALLELKNFGFIRNNRNYLTKAPEYHPNNWTCDSSKDTFIHIGAGGTVDVCSDVRTGWKIDDIGTLNNPKWRDMKKALVERCGNCMFHCYYEVQNPELIGDLPTGALFWLTRIGKPNIVRSLGSVAVAIAERRNKEVNWKLSI